MTRHWIYTVGAAAVLLRTTAAAQTVIPAIHAEAPVREAPATSQPLDSVTQKPLLENWEPRRWLAGQGVVLTGHYIGEVAGNDRGYKSAGWDYAQQLDFGAVIDLHKLGSGEGTLRVLFSDRLGKGLNSDRTGAYIQNQAYYGQGKNFRFDELSYERTFLDKRLSLKGGFYSMGNDFAGLPYVCNFNNNGNCGHPLGLLYGSGWLDSPTGQWGGRVKWTDRSGYYAEAGVYDVTPLRKTQEYGLDLGFPETSGVIAPLEFGYVRGKTPADYPGTYKIGIYYDSSHTVDLGAPGRIVTGRGGVYVQAAQQIWKPWPGTVQGISVFAIATLNDPQTGVFRTTYEAGESWRGILPDRADDIASLAWIRLDVSRNAQAAERRAGKPVQTNEQMVEVNYGAQLAPWLLLRPALQYVVRPGGYDSRPDTLIFVAHMQATF